MFPVSDIASRVFALASSFALSSVMMLTVIDYATPFAGGVA